MSNRFDLGWIYNIPNETNLVITSDFYRNQQPVLAIDDSK